MIKDLFTIFPFSRFQFFSNKNYIFLQVSSVIVKAGGKWDFDRRIRYKFFAAPAYRMVPVEYHPQSGPIFFTSCPLVKKQNGFGHNSCLSFSWVQDNMLVWEFKTEKVF
jgi:hypothetical protein